jgi:hypothetical protein
MKLLRSSPFVLSFCILATSSFALTNGSSDGAGGVVLRANVPMGTVLNTGDRVTFDYQTRKDSAVLVFNIDSQGYVHLLYPTGGPTVARARETYSVPENGDELVIDTQTGVEFVFALAVEDPQTIDSAELDHLRGTDVDGAEPYRIDGDPFIAANMIAGELVRGVSHRAASFGYTYFYVNERVEYPCYLCGACDGVADDPACADLRVVQNFDRRDVLAYPLKRAYDMVGANEDVAVDSEDGGRVVVPEGSDVDVNFYPYGVEARTMDPFYSTVWNDYGVYDPDLYGYYWPYYPYDYYPGWSLGIGFGWGWGWGWWGWGGWGGYYCSGWYAHCGWYYDPYYGCYPTYGGGGGSYTPPAKFKTKQADGSAASLTGSRTTAAKYDSDLRIGSKATQKSLSRTAQSSMRSKTGALVGSKFTSGRSKSAGVRPKTSIGGRSGTVKSAPRGVTRGSPGMKSRGTTTRRGVSGVQRGGGYKSRGATPGYRSGSRSGSGRMSAPGSSPRMKSSSSRGSYSAPSVRGGGMSRGSAMSHGGGTSRGGGMSRGGGGMKGGRGR